MRLGRQFRRDVHLADSATVAESSLADDVLLRLELPGGDRIEYRRIEDGLLRSCETSASNTVLQQFQFDSRVLATVREEPAGCVALEVLATPNQGEPQPGAPRAILDVEARLGRAWRFQDIDLIQEVER